MSALAAMQDKTTHLENSLSAETRLKLDLFSALGEAKRQMEILQSKYYFFFLSYKIVDLFKLKALSSNNLTHSHTMTLLMPLGNKPVENTVGKGEIARNEQFLLFQQCFLPV